MQILNSSASGAFGPYRYFILIDILGRVFYFFIDQLNVTQSKPEKILMFHLRRSLANGSTKMIYGMHSLLKIAGGREERRLPS